MFEKLIPELLSHKKIGVFSHIRPDGDCLGSQIALCLWLEKNGIESSAFNEDEVNKNMEWLTDFKEVQKPEFSELGDFDAFVFVDGNALHRFGDTAKQITELDKPLYMIDHHPQPEDVFKEYVSKTDASSTCELVYHLYAEHDISQINEHSAKAMYVGIVTDTGSFQFDSVKPSTMKAAASLLEYGKFTPDEVVQKIYSSKPMKQIKLLGLALETISLHENQQIATMYVTQAMFQETGTSNEDTEGFVAYPLSVDGVKACIFFREDDENRIKLSLRSQSDIDVNQWARELNGGGHKKAAGAWYEGDIEDAIKDVIKIGRQQWIND
ncbi:MAG: bifunctional oligoribonuclease/PAP phosphatase NrnA [Balneola sp.]